MQTKNNQTAISKNLFDLLNQKVQKVNKKSYLKELKEELKDIKSLGIILGVYNVKDDDGNNFLIYKIFVESDLLIKGAYREYILISNALLKKNINKEVASKINIYNANNNEKLIQTFIEFVKNKLDGDLKPGEYILSGLTLGELLEVEI